MEERLIDKEDERLIRIKKKAEGTDAEDALTPDGEEAQDEEEILVTLPEGYDEDYDQSLVGLSPEDLQKELERRKKAEEEARVEYGQLVAAAKEQLARGNFEAAASLYEQAADYSFVDDEIIKELWTARTKNFSDISPFYDTNYAEEFSDYNEPAKTFIRDKIGAALTQERERLQKEEAELAPDVLEKQETRRQAFDNHRRYYKVRLLVFAGLMALFAIATVVSSTFIVRTLSSLPVILTGAFGGATLISFVGMLVFMLKYSGASKLCRMNGKLASTQDGARLEELREKLECLKLILED